MRPVLFDPKRHEPFTATSWEEASARAWIARFADHVQSTFSPAQLWPMHPLDAGDDDPSVPFPMIYFGAAGVIWALDHLARAGAAGPLADFVPV